MTLIRMGMFAIVILASAAQVHAQVAFALTSSYPVTSVGGTCTAAADVNSDGSTDLLLASGGVLYVFTNTGNAVFNLLKSQPAYSGNVSSVIAADVNADNVPDLIATAGTSSGSFTPGRIVVFTNVASPLLEYPAAYDVGEYPRGVTAADVNLDGKVDLICANPGDGIGNTLSILTNNGSGLFATSSSPTVNGTPYSVVLFDANGDGATDVIAGHGNLTILTNNGHGGFVAGLGSAVYAWQSARYMTAANLNGDGKLELACVNLNTNAVWVFTNASNASFVLSSKWPVGSNPSHVTAADVNGDNRMDLITSNLGGSSASVLTNDGKGGFALATSPNVGGPPWCVTAADLNGDGNIDLACPNYVPPALSVLLSTPTLSITRSSNNVVVAWPSSWAGWALQESPALDPASWTAVGMNPTDDGTNKSTTFPLSFGSRFLRAFK